jgi:hypothetical protein
VGQFFLYLGGRSKYSKEKAETARALAVAYFLDITEFIVPNRFYLFEKKQLHFPGLALYSSHFLGPGTTEHLQTLPSLYRAQRACAGCVIGGYLYSSCEFAPPSHSRS